ncbi:uncharacterized protein LOC124432949 isoform X2 [Vespa crabro]|uniref:uncharacterized protein LOC124432949 isoform X1 n=2 Tax=Vespa crabro TaxID=7445 RepID=UPI001F030F0D|nr:uncharacterized protein LOC124432949 isoform X1 [Vespa crabro]XP_046838290.1 uncharacterized protein LOC124432949 isoform X2 [Vespa crabro]
MANMCELETSLPIEDFEGLIKQSLGSGVKIKNVTWKHLTDPGENFGSLILGVTINTVENSSSNALNVVVKLPPKSAYLMDLFNSPLTFKKELNFYSDIVPALKDIYRSCNLQEEVFVPHFFGGRLGLKNPNEFDSQAVIILENLVSSGYSVQNRIMGMDIEHIKYGVKELAKLHAMIIGLKVKRPDFFENSVLPILVSPNNETAVKCIMDMIHKAIDDLKNLEEAKPYMKSIEATLKSTNMTDITNEDDLWKTMIHKDFWVNNMLFRHDASGHITSMKIVDFQLCIYSYGVEDLIFFLISSAKKEVIDNNLDDMIDLYYDSFIDILKMLKVDTEQYSKSKFLELLNKCAPIKFSQCIMMVQVIQASRTTHSEVKNMENTAELFKRETSKIGNQKLLHIVETFAKKNWLL